MHDDKRKKCFEDVIEDLQNDIKDVLKGIDDLLKFKDIIDDAQKLKCPLEDLLEDLRKNDCRKHGERKDRE